MRILVSLYHQFFGDLYHGYLSSLYFANRYGDAVLTHQEYVQRPLDFYEAALTLHHIDPITEEERTRIPHFFVPEEIVQARQGDKPWVQNYIAFYTEDIPEYRQSLREQIDACLQERGETLDSFIIFGEAPLYIRALAEQYHVPLYAYEFSTVRVLSGYALNLMYWMPEGNLYGQNICEQRYRQFLASPPKTMLGRRSILALLCGAEKFCLIPMVQKHGTHPMGIAQGIGIFWPAFCICPYSDDDVLREASSVWPVKDILRRKHPADVLSDVERMQSSSDPIDFILSCERLGATASNTSFEAMLWNRTSYTRSNLMSFSFACEKDPASDARVSEDFLNFFLFCFLLPSNACIFDPEYQQWRQSGPSEAEIMERNLRMICRQLQVPEEVLDLPEEERYKSILACRGCAPEEIQTIDQNWHSVSQLNVDYTTLRSYLNTTQPGSGTLLCHTCLNTVQEGLIHSRFVLGKDTLYPLDFLPLGDHIGFVEICDILVDGTSAFTSADFSVAGALQHHMRLFPIQDIVRITAAQPSCKAKTVDIFWKHSPVSLDLLKTLDLDFTPSVKPQESASRLPAFLRRFL